MHYSVRCGAYCRSGSGSENPNSGNVPRAEEYAKVLEKTAPGALWATSLKMKEVKEAAWLLLSINVFNKIGYFQPTRDYSLLQSCIIRSPCS